jgi:gentisate 1,2-dioxygenase
VDWVRHQIQASTELLLFAYSDKAAQMKLDLFREVNL